MPSIEIKDLGLVKTNTLAISIKEHLRSTMPDGTFLDNALPEYVLVLLANKHAPSTIITELSSFVGGQEGAERFVSWLMQEYEHVRQTGQRTSVDQHSMAVEQEAQEAVVIRVPPSTSTTPRLLTVNMQTRAFSSALKDATGTGGKQFMQVDTGPSPLQASLIPPPLKKRFPLLSASHQRQHQAVTMVRDCDVDQYGKRPLLYSRVANGAESSTRNVKGNECEDGNDDITATRYPPTRLTTRSLIRRTRDYDLRENNLESNDAQEHEGIVDHSANSNAIMQKCQFWPHCKAGPQCPFIHPSEPCRYFPNCTFGDKCIYIHPLIPCKFQDKCANPQCNYQHKSSSASLAAGGSTNAAAAATAAAAVASILLQNPHHPATSALLQMSTGSFNATQSLNTPAQSTIICKFHPKCLNSQCPYLHPIPTPCKYGEHCLRADCIFTHPSNRASSARSKIMASCKFGRSCSRVGCPYLHEATNGSSSTADSSTTLSSTNINMMTGIFGIATPAASVESVKEHAENDEEETRSSPTVVSHPSTVMTGDVSMSN